LLFDKAGLSGRVLFYFPLFSFLPGVFRSQICACSADLSVAGRGLAATKLWHRLQYDAVMAGCFETSVRVKGIWTQT
jgi:hypothetical protein